MLKSNLELGQKVFSVLSHMDRWEQTNSSDIILNLGIDFSFASGESLCVKAEHRSWLKGQPEAPKNGEYLQLSYEFSDAIKESIDALIVEYRYKYQQLLNEL